ncbi:hypothetical protein [Streptomyces sp. NPDC001750]|uniref:hypothetical protein n=1 Tax=unclassified Streptomyces TaxID=2593676 RepID=UPI0036822B78
MRRSALAVELAPHGITADALALGTVRTPIDGAFPFDRDRCTGCASPPPPRTRRTTLSSATLR